MSYIELINRFWIIHEEYAFSPESVALYFYLLKINNTLSWKASFRRNNAKIQADLSIHRKKLLEAKKELADSGLIDFSSSKTNGNVTYSICRNKLNPNEVTNNDPKVVANMVAKEVTNNDPKVVANMVAKEVANNDPKVVANMVAKEVANNDPKVVANMVAKEVANNSPKVVANMVAKVGSLKLDIDKEIDIDKKKEKKKSFSLEKENVNSIDSLPKTREKKKVSKKKKVETKLEGEWKTIMNRFIEHRLLLGSPIKTSQGMAARERKLLSTSGGNLQKAKKILNQTIENEWKDFYPLKHSSNESYNANSSTNQQIINATAKHSEEEAL
jgi:hypothetical protein